MSSNIEIQRICNYCGNEFTARTTVTKLCSAKCRKANYKAQKRNDKVNQSNEETARIKNKPILEISSKHFLSIGEMSKLTGVSKRTIYRMIERGEIGFAKMGGRTILKRSEIDKLFEEPQPTNKKAIEYKEMERYTLSEIRNKYRISDKALHEVIKRNEIPKIKEGRNTYIPKTLIDSLLS